MRSWMNSCSLGIICVTFFTTLSYTLLLAVCLFALLLVGWQMWQLYRRDSHCQSYQHPDYRVPAQASTQILPQIPTKYSALSSAIAGCLGILWAGYYGLNQLGQQLPQHFEQQELWVTGQVVGLPKQRQADTHSARYQLQQRFILSPQVIASSTAAGEREAIDYPLGNIQLSWYHPIGSQAVSTIRPGDIWQLKVRLKRPRGFANPGGFDYQSWLFANGIAATGYVREDADNQRVQQMAGVPLQRWRAAWLAQLDDDLAGYPQGGLIKALVSGERDGIGPEQWQLFSHTGTNHLIVISGLHVGLIAGLMYGAGLLLGKFLLWAVPQWLPGRFNAYQVAVLTGMAAALGYSFLAGFSLPTQRALIMLSVLFTGQLLGLRISWWGRFSMALWLVLLWDPLAPLSAGFWLSFGAIAGLILGFDGYYGALPWHWRWLRPQWVVALMLLPLLLWQFGGVSVVSPLANILAVPLAGLVLIPACLLSVLMLTLDMPGAGWLLGWVDWGLAGLIQLLDWFASQPHAYLDLVASPVTLVLAAIGVVLLLLPKGWPGRWLGIVLLLPILSAAGLPQPVGRQAWPAGQFSFTVLDVGQGLAAVVQTRNHTLVYDTGPRFSPRFNTADAVLIPYLRLNGIGRLDRIMISHGDNDHAGSLQPLIKAIPYGDIVSGASSLPPTARIKACGDGDSWQWDGVMFTSWQLPPGFQQSENDRSCILSISNGRYSVLLPGDISRRGETALLARQANSKNIKANILVAPHHGSQSSSSPAFIAAVSPDYVIYTAGYLNRYNHPHPKVVQRYSQLKAQQVNTAQVGAVEFMVPTAGPLPPPLLFRQQYRRYWLDEPAQLY